MEPLICLCILLLVLEARLESQLPLVDIVLECGYVDVGFGGVRGLGVGFSREGSLLVLRQVPVSREEDTAAWTDYTVREEDRQHLIFEATASELPIPYAALLLHAECEGQQVTCEISALESPGDGEGEGEGGVGPAPTFGASVRLAGSSLGLAMVLRSTPVAPEVRVTREVNEKLGVVLSVTGTIEVRVEFLVYSRTTEIRTPLQATVQLDCGFEGADPREVALEWRRQHKGKGSVVYSVKEGEGTAEREGARMELDALWEDGNASLRLPGISVKDEGIYICTVRGPEHSAQQTVSVEIVMPPRVTLRPPALYFQEEVSETLTCEAALYYPLDVTIQWLLRLPGEETGSQELPGVSFSSHRRNRDGTFNISSQLAIRPGIRDLGAVYLCEVSHLGLDVPLTVSLLLQEAPGNTAQNLGTTLSLTLPL
ncbi:tapasin-related protein-like, partial [Hemiscyllium ocellatum]|uniref:tapasin-related protein-like n=1 Tax=Hemiscyllium ocellatum TaxID=170820 RepID=UPI0029665FC3